MSEISGNTLMMAIQAVDAEMRGIEDELEGADADISADLEELLLSWSKAADELKTAYEAALLSQVNLPPYEDLVQRDD